MKLIYPTKEQIIEAHNKVIEISGGLEGIKYIGHIESPLYHIEIDDYYPNFEDKLTHLVFSINKNHAFEDGNKRTSIAVGVLFLELNGFEVDTVRKFIREMGDIAVCVADNHIDKDFLKEIIFSIIFEDDYDEELKIRIIWALEKMKVTHNEHTETNDELY
ncbi:type II toxin-antitoxin system death-on-curing family toxin [Capnocytophaga canis]|uniref:type II toxin-antitoxin system death-on-curing family toxin n=1 Tax=Capnocytophaga TaxID=1016 RepID=UPI001AC9B1FD|nr:type II toxin-antitoxin system death-on-curing family toxin [Capnocytophaga cynodegmi]GIM54387.1 hypothetical protein CAPN005_10340 [Capnocytophaga cynodegmi]